MKINKNKKTLGIIIGASAVALSTIGFAGWIIDETIALEKQNVTVDFGAVTDKTITSTLVTSDVALKFDAEADSKGKVTGASDSAPDLVFSFNYTLKVGEGSKLNKIKFDFTEEAAFKKLVTDGYIVAPYAATQELTIDSSTPDGIYVNSNNTFTAYAKGTASGKEQAHDVKYAAATNTYTVTSTFTFKWGAKFNNVNPSKADDVNTPVTADQVVANLKAFNTDYANAKGNQIHLVITPTVA